MVAPSAPEQPPKKRRPNIGPYAILASDFWLNPKVIAAGPLGALVYAFALTRNAWHGRTGTFPSSELEPSYLGRVLGLSGTDAEVSRTRCMTSHLLAEDGEVIQVVGWSAEWKRADLTAAETERKAEYRRSKISTIAPSGPQNKPVRKKREEKRREEKREKDIPGHVPVLSGTELGQLGTETGQLVLVKSRTDHQLAIDHFHDAYLNAYGEKPDWKGASAKLMADLVKAHGIEAVRTKVDRLFAGQHPSWLKPPFTVMTLKAHWNSLVDTSAPDPLMRIALGLDQ